VNRNHVGYLLALGLSVAASAASAQNKPFPQNVRYPHGFTSSSLSSADARAVYDVWKQRYLKTDCGNGYYRVEFNNPTGTTVSEGMGYGMLLTAYYGDRAAFDGLWKFVQKNVNVDGLMGCR
jgi:endoglucanase